MENTTSTNQTMTPRERHIQAVGLFTLIIQLIVEAVKARKATKTGSAIRETQAEGCWRKLIYVKAVAVGNVKLIS